MFSIRDSNTIYFQTSFQKNTKNTLPYEVDITVNCLYEQFLNKQFYCCARRGLILSSIQSSTRLQCRLKLHITLLNVPKSIRLKWERMRPSHLTHALYPNIRFLPVASGTVKFLLYQHYWKRRRTIIINTILWYFPVPNYINMERGLGSLNR